MRIDRDYFGGNIFSKAAVWSVFAAALLGCAPSDADGTARRREEQAIAAYQSGDVGGAIALFDENRAEGALSTQGMLLFGQIMFLEGRLSEAEELLMELIRIERSNVDGRKWLTRVYLQQGDADAALLTIREASEMSSGDPEVMMLAGLSYQAGNELSFAVELLSQALVRIESLAEIPLEAARLYHRLGDSEEAVEALRRARAMLSDESGLRVAIDKRIAAEEAR